MTKLALALYEHPVPSTDVALGWQASSGYILWWNMVLAKDLDAALAKLEKEYPDLEVLDYRPKSPSDINAAVLSSDFAQASARTLHYLNDSTTLP